MFCKRCNWKKHISNHECQCLKKDRWEMKIYEKSFKEPHITYHCETCGDSHIIQHNEIPLFYCRKHVDLFRLCTQNDYNSSVFKLCSNCMSIQNGVNLGFVWYCEECNLYKLEYLNGQQLSCYNPQDTTFHKGHFIFDNSNCSLHYD